MGQQGVAQQSLADIRRRPRTPSKRKDARQATRRRLLAAGLDAFLADGYAMTTVDSIAARAEVSRPAFYLHFEGKLELLQALNEEELRPVASELFARLDAVLASGDRAAFRALLVDVFVAATDRGLAVAQLLGDA